MPSACSVALCFAALLSASLCVAVLAEVAHCVSGCVLCVMWRGGGGCGAESGPKKRQQIVGACGRGKGGLGWQPAVNTLPVPVGWGGWAFNFGGGGGCSIQPFGWTPAPIKRAIGGPPKILPRLTPGPPMVTWIQIWAQNENGILGIRASRGFRKVITCHAFDEKRERDHFQCSKEFSVPSVPEFIINDEWSCQLSPFPGLPLQFWGVYRPPPPPEALCQPPPPPELKTGRPIGVAANDSAVPQHAACAAAERQQQNAVHTHRTGGTAILLSPTDVMVVFVFKASQSALQPSAPMRLSAQAQRRGRGPRGRGVGRGQGGDDGGLPCAPLRGRQARREHAQGKGPVGAKEHISYLKSRESEVQSGRPLIVKTQKERGRPYTQSYFGWQPTAVGWGPGRLTTAVGKASVGTSGGLFADGWWQSVRDRRLTATVQIPTSCGILIFVFGTLFTQKFSDSIENREKLFCFCDFFFWHEFCGAVFG